jgi:hypothetical protein
MQPHITDAPSQTCFAAVGHGTKAVRHKVKKGVVQPCKIASGEVCGERNLVEEFLVIKGIKEYIPQGLKPALVLPALRHE